MRRALAPSPSMLVPRALASFLGLGLLLLAPGAGRAQDDTEIQVYGAALVPPHTTMFELHSNFTVAGRREIVDGLWPSNHAVHETLEITHGFTPWLEVGFYTFTSARAGDGVRWVGNHIRPRVAIPESWHWPVGLSLSQEIGYEVRSFSEDTWTWEIRPIIDKRFGPLYVSLNPVLERAFKGPGTADGLAYSPNAAVKLDVTPKVTAGVEYYGGLGSTAEGFLPYAEQDHQLFPTIDLNLSPDWEFNFGVGWSLTDTTDHTVVKMIVGRRAGF